MREACLMRKITEYKNKGKEATCWLIEQCYKLLILTVSLGLLKLKILTINSVALSLISLFFLSFFQISFNSFM